MKMDTFVLWKFKNYEGKLKWFHSGDVYTSIIQKGLDKYRLKYDCSTNTAVLTDFWGTKTLFTCHFKYLDQKLKELGLYEEAIESERHSSSYIPIEVDLDVI